ncbi:Uncharacterised protein [Chlamydia trachomatis]|nr:Uncharacterised protein [Chlamydia trachomatis]
MTQTANSVYKANTMNTELIRARGSIFPGFLNSPAMKQIAAIPVYAHVVADTPPIKLDFWAPGPGV